MVQTLEAIKGGGGSIKVGTTGTISSLMSRELDTTKQPSPQTSAITPRKLKSKASNDEPSTSTNRSNPTVESVRKTKHHIRKTHQIPILEAENVSISGTPIKKTERKGSCMVEIVDIKCGNPDRAWSSRPITNRLKKLGFSKLSETVN